MTAYQFQILPNKTSSLTKLPASCLRDLATEDAMAMTKLREERQSRLLRCCRPNFDRVRLPLQWCARHPALAGKDLIMKIKPTLSGVTLSAAV